MHKWIGFLNSAIGNPTWSWINTAASNWNTAGNWSPASVPTSANNTTVKITATPPAARTLTLDINTTVNQLIGAYSNASGEWTIAGTNTLTFAGTNASLTSTSNSGLGITCPVTLSSNLTMGASTGTSVYGIGWTSSSKNITKTGTGGSFFNTTGNTGITGGNFFLNGGRLVINGTALGGATGMTINVANTDSSIILFPFTNTVANPIILIDTGTNTFKLGGIAGEGSSSGYSGTISGTITHDIEMATTLTFSGTMSGLSMASNAFTFTNTTAAIGININTSTFPACTINLSTGGTNLTGAISTNQIATLPININVPCRTTTAASTPSIFSTAAGLTTISGNVVLNSNSSTFAGSTLQIGNSSGTLAFSGVISNGVSGAANITLAVVGTGITRLSNTNTYTSPTTVTSGIFDLRGSISTSASLNLNGAELDLTGTAPATTFTGTSSLVSYQAQGTPAVTDFGTVNGNLITTVGTTFKFKTAATNLTSKIVVNGNITLASGPVTILTPVSGTFTVMTYTGTLSGTFGTITAAGHTATATYTGGNVIITII